MTEDEKTAYFWANVDTSGGTEACWPWTGPMAWGGRSGYGQAKGDYAHRVSWRIHRGEIPKGMLICHHCDMKDCANPAHLYAGTYSDNNRDMYERNLDVRAKLSTINKGEGNGFYGKQHSPEARAKMSRSLKGKMRGDDNPMYGKRGENNPNYGKKHSAEARAKMATARSLYWERRRQQKEAQS